MADPDDAIAAKIDVGEAITTIRGENRHTYAATSLLVKGENLLFPHPSYPKEHLEPLRSPVPVV